MTKKYLVRLDDACPFMDSQKWDRIENILNKYGIKPLVGIIPCNEDTITMVEEADPDFYKKAQQWQKQGWSIALHGCTHVYATECGGINPIHSRSEFAGLSYDEQVEKIKKGYAVLINRGLYPTYFFAPSHTYDENTIKALKSCTPIKLLSDTMARFPYKYDQKFTIVPCQMGRFRNILLKGYWSFCYHPNIMNDSNFAEFESFISINKDLFISFNQLPIENAGKKSFIDKLLSLSYLTLRKIKG